MIVLTDGGDNGTSHVLRTSGNHKRLSGDIDNLPWRRRKQIVRDKIHNKIMVHESGHFTAAFVDHMRNCHNMNAIGFMLCKARREVEYALDNFICDNNNTINSFWQNKEVKKVARAEMRKNGFISAKDEGYNEYFIIKPTDTKDEELNINSSMTKGAIGREFSKHNRSKKTNRQLLNKFVDLVK